METYTIYIILFLAFLVSSIMFKFFFKSLKWIFLILIIAVGGLWIYQRYFTETGADLGSFIEYAKSKALPYVSE